MKANRNPIGYVGTLLYERARQLLSVRKLITRVPLLSCAHIIIIIIFIIELYCICAHRIDFTRTSQDEGTLQYTIICVYRLPTVALIFREYV